MTSRHLDNSLFTGTDLLVIVRTVAAAQPPVAPGSGRTTRPQEKPQELANLHLACELLLMRPWFQVRSAAQLLRGACTAARAALKQ